MAEDLSKFTTDDFSFLDDIDDDTINSVNDPSDDVESLLANEPTLVEFGLNTKLPEAFKKAHKAVFSIHDQSPHEQNIFNIMNAKMSISHWENGKSPIYEFRAAELAEWLGISPKHIGTTLNPAAKRLMARSVGFTVDTDNGEEFEYISIFSKVKYANAKLTIIPNPMLKDFLMEFNRGYALINTSNIIKLKKSYSKRIYEFLSRFKEEGTYLYPMKLDSLRHYFGLFDEKGNLHKGKKSLKTPSVFITRCIEDSIEEINKICPNEIIFFKGEQGHLGYTPIKKGRYYIGVKFHYQWLNTKIKLSTEDALSTIKELEHKRLIKKEMLSNGELELLSLAYIKVDLREKAIKLIKVLQERNLKAAASAKDSEQTEELSILDKIAQLESMNPDVGY
ncbi:MAG: replication initiation protein [Cocleimonas sp.]